MNTKIAESTTVKFLEIKWSISKGRNTYGYNICRLQDTLNYQMYTTCGGGYDMIGTVFAEWLQNNHQDRLQKLAGDGVDLKEYGSCGYKHVLQFGGMFVTPEKHITLDGGYGIASMLRIAESIGLNVRQTYNGKGDTIGFTVAYEDSETTNQPAKDGIN